MNDHHNALPAGYRLGEYEIQTVLGSGGFGVTYKAHDHNLDKQVAIKEYLPPEFAVRDGRTTVKPKSSASKDDYAWGLDRFLDEARALARFDHPHINKVYRFFKDNGTAYLVLEYVEGDMLSELLKSKGRFNEAGVRRMLDELLDGLDKVHRAGYIHRDIKPANIIFRRDGSAVLLDFGAARQAIGQRSQMITSILTPGYAPVEQYLNTADAMGAWSDLYSLGVVAYRCLVGGDESVVIDAPSRAHYAQRGESEKDMQSAAEVGKGNYSDGLLKAIDWAMKVDERERPQSVGELRAVLAGESEVEVVATVPVVKKAKKKAAKKVRAKRAVKVDQTKGAQVPAGWVFGVIGLAVLVGVGLGVPQYLQWRASTEVLRVERDEFRKFTGHAPSAHRVSGGDITDLHTAAAQGWAKLVQWLINNGANVHAQDYDNSSPLHYATAGRAEDAAKVLLENGANVNVQNIYGTPLHQVSFAPRGVGRLDFANMLIAYGANVNSRNNEGFTPLHKAASSAVDIAKLLIASGSDVNAKNNDDRTPLHSAALGKSVDGTKLLLANGADVHAKDIEGGTPLHSAVIWNARGGVAKLLLANGADVNAQGHEDWTPLDSALFEGNSAMQSLLRRHGGRCNKHCR